MNENFPDLSEMSIDELVELIDACHLEMNTKRHDVPLIRISIEYGCYNFRRYSRPWISKIIEWSTGESPVVDWGVYVGDDAGGEVEIMAKPGDIIRSGQKDNRGNNSVRDWYIVAPDGTLVESNPKHARHAYMTNSLAKTQPYLDAQIAKKYAPTKEANKL